MEKEDNIPDFHPIKDNQGLAELNGYEIDGICESAGKDNKSMIIFLKRTLPDGKVAHREFMITKTKCKFMTNEY